MASRFFQSCHNKSNSAFAFCEAEFTFNLYTLCFITFLTQRLSGLSFIPTGVLKSVRLICLLLYLYIFIAPIIQKCKGFCRFRHFPLHLLYHIFPQKSAIMRIFICSVGINLISFENISRSVLINDC